MKNKIYESYIEFTMKQPVLARYSIIEGENANEYTKEKRMSQQ